MPMLTQTELDDLRVEFNDLFFPDTCVVMRAGLAAPDEFGWSDSSFAAAGTIACRFDPFSKQSDFAEFGGERVSARSWYRATFHWDADVAETDNLVFEGDTYEILQMYRTHSLHVVRRALCAKIPGEAP